MQCPKCKATVPGDSKFCQICGGDVRSVIPIDHGTPRYDPFSTLGDLDQDTNANIQDDNVIGFSHNGGRKRVYYVGEDGLWRDKEIDEVGREIPPVAPKRNTLFCTGCGKPTPADSVFCEHCGKQLLTIPTQKKFHWKKWMTAVACGAVLLLVMLVIPWSNNANSASGIPNQNNMQSSNGANNVIDEFTPPAGYDEGYSITKEYIASSTEGIYKMKEYNGNTWFCRVSVPSWFTPVSEEVDTGDIWNPYYLYIVNTENYEDFTFQSVTKGEDQLALVGITSVSCAPIIEMDYTIPYYLGAYSGSIHYKRSIGYLIGGYNEDFEEINGQEPSAYLNRLSDYYNVFRANKGESFTFSYFSGTDYLEETVTADHFYYIIEDHNSYISLPVTKTTEGYFIVDYSELSPGYYWFSVGGDDTIIEIKG